MYEPYSNLETFAKHIKNMSVMVLQKQGKKIMK